MKQLLLLSFLIVKCISLQSQCKPVFRLKPNQPASPPAGYWSNVNFNFSGTDLHLTTMRTVDTTGLKDTVIIQHWKDTSWVSYPKLYLREYSYYRLMRWNNRLFIAGNFKQFNNNSAPTGYRYTILELRNGVWDSLPGCLLSDSNYQYNSYSYCTDGIYRMDFKLVRNSFNQYYHNVGKISVYDTTSGSFDSIASFISYNNSRMVAGNNRLLIAGIDTINGQKTYGFATIDGNVVNRNTDNRFPTNSYYYVDFTDDHVYVIPYSGSPLILEYSTAFVSSRQTTSFPHTSTGGAGVHDGKIVYVSYDVDDNQYVNVLCKNQTQWNTIVNQGGLHKATNMIFTNSGFYYYDYYQKKFMMLDEGSSIKGVAFIDLDSNCLRDTLTEPLLKDKLVTATATNFKVSALTDAKGRYDLFVAPGTYELSGPSVKTNCGPDTVVITSNGTTSSQNLPLLRPGFHDLKARLLNGFVTRWNSITTYHALFENLGEPSDSAYFEFDIDGKLDIRSFDPAVKTVTGNKASGQLKNLGYFDKRMVSISAWVDTATTKPDSIVCTSLLAYLYTPEQDSANNLDTVCQKVVYSFDPNYKSCSRDTIPVNVSTKLEYMIEFQNEGNDDAYDVVITDQLSSLLDLETFRIIGASHPYTITLVGRLLTITFKDIYLKPKKTDEKLSQGYFKYSISTNTGLKNLTSIKNTAYIYFDLNKPVITNTSVVIVSDGTTGIAENYFNRNPNLKAYPNPSRGELSIVTSLDEEIHVYSLEGREIMVIMPVDGVAVIDMSEWPAGIYLLRCGNSYCKVVKEDGN